MFRQFLSLILAGILCALSFSASGAEKVLMVVSGHGTDSDERRPGYEFDEFALAYAIFTANGLDVDIASPNGGEVTAGKFNKSKPYNAQLLADTRAMAKLSQTISTASVDPEKYAAVFIVGGKGAVFDLPFDHALQRVITGIHQQEGIVSAVCHGPAALVDVKLADGSYLVAGKTVTGFTNDEEAAFAKEWQDKYPFSLQDRLVERGGRFEEVPIMLPNAITTGRLITGQNPYSTILVAEAVVRATGREPVQRTIHSDERSMSLLSRVVAGDHVWAKDELAANNAAYDIPLIGIWGHYALIGASGPDAIRHAVKAMELASPYMDKPMLQLSLAKGYLQLGAQDDARRVLMELISKAPDLQEAKDMLLKLEG